jgi:N-acetylneuraminic acid mutarotase
LSFRCPSQNSRSQVEWSFSYFFIKVSKLLLCVGVRSTNRSISLFFVLVFLTASCIIIIQPAKASADSWVTKAPMPSANAGEVAVAVNGEIYVIGSNFTYMYNPTTNTWVSKTPLPTHQQSFAVSVYQHKISVSGGCSGFNQITGYPINCSGVNEEYNPATDKWESRAPMPTARAELQANVVNGKIYLIGGTLPNGSISNITEVYNPSNDLWNTAAPIPIPVGLYASAVVDNKIYVEGGGKSGPIIIDLNQIYDPITNVWTLGAALPASVLWAAASATTGVLAPTRLYVIGGTTDGINAVNTTYIYDPQLNSWTLGSPMPTARGALSVAVVNDTLYTLGGTDNFLGLQDRTNVVNEQYFPLGYGELAPSPSQHPTSSSTPQSTMIYYVITAALAIIIIVVIVTLFLRKRRSSTLAP